MIPRRLTRRQFLRLAAVGTGAALSACGGSTPSPTPALTSTQAPSFTPAPSRTPAPTASVPATPTLSPTPLRRVEIFTSGWPVDVFTEAEAALDPARQASMEALRVWLDNHPGVTLTKVPVDVFDPLAMQTAIDDGAAPTFLYGPAVGGGFSRDAAVAAFTEGQLADVTASVEANRLSERILPALWRNWSDHSNVNGSYFAYPLNEYAPTTGIWVYNKDLLARNDICLPETGWTWEQAIEIMKAASDESQRRAGLSVPYNFIATFMAQHGSEILTEIPAPDLPWHWLRDWSDPRWGALAAEYRRLIFRHKAIYSDSVINTQENILALFRSGNSVFAPAGYWDVFGDPSDPNSLPNLADQRGLQFEDAFGVVAQPAGDGYKAGGDALWGPVSFNPNHTPEQIALAVDLIEWMYFGKGLDIARASLWNRTHDPRKVFRAFLYLDGRDRYEGVSARVEDAWGDGVIQTWRAFSERPVMPQKKDFFPLELIVGPANQPFDDLFLRIVSVGDNINSEAKLKQATAAWNEAAQRLTSSIPAEDFRAGAQSYYAALEAYLRDFMPEFYQNRFLPVYQAKILPNLVDLE